MATTTTLPFKLVCFLLLLWSPATTVHCRALLDTSTEPDPPSVPSALTVTANVVFPNEYSASIASATLGIQVWYDAKSDYTRFGYGDDEQEVYMHGDVSRAVFTKVDRRVCVNAQGFLSNTDPPSVLTALLLSDRISWHFGGTTNDVNRNVDIQIWRIVTINYLASIYWDNTNSKPVSLEVTTLTVGYQLLFQIEDYSTAAVDPDVLAYPSLCNKLEPRQDVNMTDRQIASSFSGRRNFPKLIYGKTLPETFDLREEFVMTPVKEQRTCGSCWAHAVAGAVELAVMRAIGKSFTLSEQELIDCASWTGAMQLNAGCFGGFNYVGMEYVLRQKGLHLRNNYLYKGINGVCQSEQLVAQNFTKFGTEIAGYYGFVEDLWAGNNMTFRAQLKEAIYRFGGVTVFYYSVPCSNLRGTAVCRNVACYPTRSLMSKRDHVVQLIGWGTDYWIFKNSWGQGWADGGYGRIDMVYDCGMGYNNGYQLAIPFLKGWELGLKYLRG